MLRMSLKRMTSTSKYRPLLRPIGAYLDTLNVRDLVLAETEQGFVWRCCARANAAQLLHGVIGHDAIPHLTEVMKASRLGRVPDLDVDVDVRLWAGLRMFRSSASIVMRKRHMGSVCPFGYEELLRSLSHKLDCESAASFLLHEDAETILVQITQNVPLFVQMDPDRFVASNYFHEDVLDRDHVIALVRQVRSFRGSKYFH